MVAPEGPEVLRASKFELAPPRRFVLPAVLLLLSEHPGHGYSLEKDLGELSFGRIDRPSVYRALAQLEKDGLVESWAEAPKAGHERRVYGVTNLGERVLRAWMSVIKDERDLLGRVLRRYQATGTLDAMLAEFEGGWAEALGSGWSPVSATSVGPRHLKPVGADLFDVEVDFEVDDEAVEGGTGPKRFTLVPDRSVVLIEVRSTVGPLSFGAVGVTGHVDVAIVDGAVCTDTQPVAHVEIAVDGLRSGNGLYDAELMRRIDARCFPTATLDLTACRARDDSRYRLAGELTFHGVTRPAEGTVNVAARADGRLVVTGEQVFDIRDFDVPSPTVLMLRIYPDVRVHLHVEAELEKE